MGLDNAEQVKLYKTYWYPMEQSFGQTQKVSLFNRFMRDYLTLRSGEIPNVDKVYDTFKVYHQNKSHIPMEEIVADIYRYSKYFTRMVLAREKDPVLKRCFEDIQTLEINVVYPFLLEIYDDYEQQHLSHADFVAILRLVESYVFRRFICGIPTHGLNKVFATLAKEIDKEHYLESVQALFLQRSAGARFPRDEEFRAAFVVKDIYNSPASSRHYLLSKLENFKRKELVNVDEYTIEHILPQNANLSQEWQEELGPNWREIQEKYLHTIGNLTLTRYNPSMSDRSFREKRTIGFLHSPLQLNEDLGRVEGWNAEAIEKRAQRLVALALEIWAIPSLSTEQLNMYGKRIQKAPLVEVVGPVEHPLAGFVPAGYKIIPLSDKKFHYYRLLDGNWQQYGNGKVAWYAISWASAGKNIREFARKQEKPLGVGGETHPYYAKIASGSIPITGQYDEDLSGEQAYTVDSYPYLQGSMRALFESLRKRILNLDPLVHEEYKKIYIAYKTTTNFVDIEPQKSRLLLFLNMPFSEISDPDNLCRDMTLVGHHGTGHVAVSFSSPNQLDAVMELIRQAFERCWEEGVV
jgi:predicted transport protein